MVKKIGSLILIFLVILLTTTGVLAGNTTVAGTIAPTSGMSAGGEDLKTAGFAGSVGATGSAVTAGDNAGSEGAGGVADILLNGDKPAGVINDKVHKTEFEIGLEKILLDGSAVDNGQLFVTITSPDREKDSTYKKSYIISGKSDFNDIIIVIRKFNEVTRTYETMYNTDGEDSWEINSTGIFSKEIILTPGVNKIKILAYRTSFKEEDGKSRPLQEGDYQVNCFAIELLNNSIEQQMTKKTDEIRANIFVEITESLRTFLQLLGRK